MHTDLHSGTPDPAEAATLRATLGALLRRLRREAGVSTRALADRSAVARSTITRLEAGRRRPRPAMLAALAYGLDPDRTAELTARLERAAGDSLRPDTEGGRRRLARRRRRRQREVELRVDSMRLQAGAMLLHARRLTRATLRLLSPHATWEEIDLADRLDARAVLLVEEGLRLDEAALAPRHPLADPVPPM